METMEKGRWCREGDKCSTQQRLLDEKTRAKLSEEELEKGLEHLETW